MHNLKVIFKLIQLVIVVPLVLCHEHLALVLLRDVFVFLRFPVHAHVALITPGLQLHVFYESLQFQLGGVLVRYAPLLLADA